MKTILIFILFAALAFPQSKYTKEDQEFAEHVKQEWKSSTNSNYEKRFPELIAECNNYIKAHPNTAIKPGLLGYTFEMTATLNPGVKAVRNAGNTLLKYDHSFSTRLRVAQILIEKNLDNERGIEIVKKLIREAKNPKDYYDANLLLASGELHLKNYKISFEALNAAVKSDSSRIDGYNGLLQVMPLAGEEKGLEKVKEKLSTLEKDPNINVDLSSFSFFDINEDKVGIQNFKGSIIAMIFFKFECPYCRKEMPVFSELMKKHPKIKFIYINMEELVSDIKFKYLKEDKYSFLRDQSIARFTDSFDKILDITITPQVLIIDKNSIVKYDFRGYKEDFPEKFEEDIKLLQ